MKANFLFLILILLSVFLYGIHYIIFGDAIQTISGIVLSLAYVPLGVIYQILVLDKIIEIKEKISSSKKMNMILGTFYHEMGNMVLAIIAASDERIEELRLSCNMSQEWEEDDFDKLIDMLNVYKCDLNMESLNLEKIDAILERENKFLLDLITNSTLVEYKEFTDMVICTLYVSDFLQERQKEKTLVTCEKCNFMNDICDLYRYLLVQWVEYMRLLKKFYPALFLKAIVNSPFNSEYVSKKEKHLLKFK